MIASIISKNIRMRCPDLFTVGEGSVIDDYCYISVGLSMGRLSHIGTGCSLVGGRSWHIRIGDFCSIVMGTRLICKSNDFTNDLTIAVPEEMPLVQNLIEGNIIFANYSVIGANSVMMSNNHVPEGVAIGALSYVPSNYPFEPWTIYFGTPIKPRKKRNRDSVLKQVEVVKKYLHEGI